LLLTADPKKLVGLAQLTLGMKLYFLFNNNIIKL